MARARITEVKNDLTADSGAVLWSFIRGEQLEATVTLDFLPPNANVTDYVFEAVVLEAENTEDNTLKPTTVKPGGVQTTLSVRKPNYVGVWSDTGVYNFEDVVLHFDGKYYRLKSGLGYTSNVSPQGDPVWVETTLNRVYIQFPATLGVGYAQQPTAEVPVYGFIELRVTEPFNYIYVRTWKPVRGMVELHFSPTDAVG